MTGDTAKKFSENFGRIMQNRESRSISSSDTSISKSLQLEAAIPASKIATLSSGEFVGIVADNPDQKISLKMFHSEIQNDHLAIKNEEATYKMIPVVENVTVRDVEEVYKKIKAEVKELVINELNKLYPSNNPDEEKPGESKDQIVDNNQVPTSPQTDIPPDQVGPI